MDIDAEAVKLIAQGGPALLLAIIVLLFVHDPDRAEKAKAFILRPLFRLFGWGARQYLAAEVNSKTTEFLKWHVSRLIPSLQPVKVAVRWVLSPSDPILRRDGTLILRLQDTGDQTRNALAAAQVALPRVVCVAARTHVASHITTAIDLTLLRNMAERLGKHARPVFQQHFLNPEMAKDQQIATLFQELVELDTAGVFVSVFLEEVNLLGDVLYADADQSDRTVEVVDFLHFLLRFARRTVGEEIPLEFHSAGFHVGILLLAKSFKAAKEGVVPYVRRIDRYITLRCESIYIAAYDPARGFADRILAATGTDARLSLVKKVRIFSRSMLHPDGVGVCEIALLRPNTVSSDVEFSEQIKELGFTTGMQVEGRVVDVAADFAVVDVGGITAVIRKQECSWFTVVDCTEFLVNGSTYRFLISLIDEQRRRVELSRRFPDDDPWRTAKLPKKGDIVEVTVMGIHAGSLVARWIGSIEVMIPVDELSWTEGPPADLLPLVGVTRKVIIFEKSIEQRVLRGSIRRIEKDPWPDIYARFPANTELTVPVTAVSSNYVTVQLPGGIPGRVASGEFKQAGFEYTDFEQNVVVGQRLQVVVSKVFVEQQRIRLRLKRNTPPQER